MPRKSQPEFYVARSSGVVKIDGNVEYYVAGKTIVHRDSPMYKAAKSRFVPVERQDAVEQATAAPGEQRTR